MSAENLNQTDLQCGNLSMPRAGEQKKTGKLALVNVHEDACQIELNLETDVDIGTIDSRTPPQCESTIGDLIQTGPLGVGKFLVSHGLFETRCFLPKETLIKQFRSHWSKLLQ